MGRSPLSSSVEQPGAAARPSSILQMWRQLEHVTVAAWGRRGSATESLVDGDRSCAEGRDLSGGSSMAPSETDYNGYDQWLWGDLDLLLRPGEEEEDNRRSSREQSPPPVEPLQAPALLPPQARLD